MMKTKKVIVLILLLTMVFRNEAHAKAGTYISKTLRLVNGGAAGIARVSFPMGARTIGFSFSPQVAAATIAIGILAYGLENLTDEWLSGRFVDDNDEEYGVFSKQNGEWIRLAAGGAIVPFPFGNAPAGNTYDISGSEAEADAAFWAGVNAGDHGSNGLKFWNDGYWGKKHLNGFSSYYHYFYPMPGNIGVEPYPLTDEDIENRIYQDLVDTSYTGGDEIFEKVLEDSGQAYNGAPNYVRYSDDYEEVEQNFDEAIVNSPDYGAAEDELDGLSNDDVATAADAEFSGVNDLSDATLRQLADIQAATDELIEENNRILGEDILPVLDQIATNTANSAGQGVAAGMSLEEYSSKVDEDAQAVAIPGALDFDVSIIEVEKEDATAVLDGIYNRLRTIGLIERLTTNVEMQGATATFSQSIEIMGRSGTFSFDLSPFESIIIMMGNMLLGLCVMTTTWMVFK